MNTSSKISEKTNTSSINLAIEIYKVLSKVRRRQLCLLAVLMVISGISEILSISSFVPFLNIFTGSSEFIKSPVIAHLITYLGITSFRQTAIFLGLVFLILALFSSSIRLLTIYISCKLACLIGSDLSCKAYKQSLYQDYEYHLQTNASSIISTITVQIGASISAILGILQMISSSIICLSLIFALLLFDWEIATISISIMIVSYLFIIYKSKKILYRNSKIVAVQTKAQFKVLQEGLGAIRDVILSNNQPKFLSHYQDVDRPMRLSQAINQFVPTYPRYVIEFIAIALLTILSLLFVFIHKGNLLGILPALGTFALASQRLLPAFQLVYSSWANFKAKSKSVIYVLEAINLDSSKIKKRNSMPLQREIVEIQNISFENVSYKYKNSSTSIINDVSFTIKRGERIGIVGETGSGKSTLIDLLVGLLKPSEGTIKIDNKNIHSGNFSQFLVNWQSSIAYVPQDIFLSDSSIAENIAFGEEKSDINYFFLNKSLESAHIIEFINSLPNGIESRVGERGVQLSGGQRQRLGIARALYKKSKIIILDEATSALDSTTEKAILNSIDSIKEEITLIMVAHRVSTLKSCDRIFELNKGEIKRIYLNEEFFSNSQL